MLLVKTYVGPSKIHGTGLFAGRDIAKGEEIWSFHPITCSKSSLSQFLSQFYKLKFDQIMALLNYSYIKDNFVYSIQDNTRYINHSLRPNVGLIDTQTEVALRDIKKGEEILENYFDSYDQNDFYFISHLFEFKDKNHIIETLENFYAIDKDLSRPIAN